MAFGAKDVYILNMPKCRNAALGADPFVAHVLFFRLTLWYCVYGHKDMPNVLSWACAAKYAAGRERVYVCLVTVSIYASPHTAK